MHPSYELLSFFIGRASFSIHLFCIVQFCVFLLHILNCMTTSETISDTLCGRVNFVNNLIFRNFNFYYVHKIYFLQIKYVHIIVFITFPFNYNIKNLLVIKLIRSTTLFYILIRVMTQVQESDPDMNLHFAYLIS